MAALLLFGDTARSPALRHEVPLAILDSLMFCERDGRRFVLAKHLERSRIERAFPDAEILDFFDFGMKQLAESGRCPRRPSASSSSEPRDTSSCAKRRSRATSRSRSLTDSARRDPSPSR